MKYAVTSQEMKICDRNTSEHFGISTEVLMERASLAIADEIDSWKKSRSADRKYSVLVLAGVGNNGGDGICAGRLLSQRENNLTLASVETKVADETIASAKMKIALTDE